MAQATTTTPPAAAQPAAPAKQAATTTPPAADPKAAAVAPTPPASNKMPESLGSRLRGGPKPLTPEEKAAKDAEDKKNADAEAEAAKKKAEDEKAKAAGAAPAAGEGDDGKKVTPAKRVVRKAAGYEGAPGVEDATKKLADAASKLADAATKVGATAPVSAPAAVVLTDDEKDEIAVLEAMGDLDKAKFGHLAEKAKEFITTFPKFEQEVTAKFKADWERKNPASKFDDDDERDKAFSADLQAKLDAEILERRKQFKLDYSERDFRKGENHLATKPLLEQQRQTQAELRRLQEEKAAREAETAAKDVAPAAVADIVSQSEAWLGAEFKGVLTEDGGIDDKVFATVKDGKYIKPYIESAVRDSGAFAEAAVRVENGLPTPNEDKVWFAIREYEREMMGKAESERTMEIEEGGRKVVKRFTTIREMQNMTPAQQREHYTVDSDALILFANQKLLEIAKKKIDERRAELAELRSEIGGGAPAPAAAAPSAGRTAKPNSPAVTAGATPSGTAAAAPGGLFRKRFGGA